MKELMDLFIAFFKIGSCTLGGGYAMLPMLERELVEKRAWVTNDELLDYFAIGQCTPGIIAINTATFVGQKRRGVLGAIFSTLGMVAPSIIIILCIAALIDRFAENVYVQHAFSGIRVAVGVLILSSIVKLFKSNVKSWVDIALFVLAFIIIAVLGASPMWVVIGAPIVGILMMQWRKKA